MICPSCTHPREAKQFHISFITPHCVYAHAVLEGFGHPFSGNNEVETRRRSCFSGKHRQLWHYSMGFESSSVHSPFHHADFFYSKWGISGRIWKITPTFVFSFHLPLILCTPFPKHLIAFKIEYTLKWTNEWFSLYFESKTTVVYY